MLTDLCQRWSSGRASYRPAGEPIRTLDYEVAELSQERDAKAFVVAHHYDRSFPAARARYGLFHRGELVGVAVLSQPPSQAALEAALPIPGAERVELGRFVLLDQVPANGESWMLARCFELARREGFEALVAHSDPEPRRTRDGALVFPGHRGTIYRATNAVFTGRTRARTRRVLPDGTIFSDRAWSKLRLRERGWTYAAEVLLSHGAPEPAGDWRAWVTRAVHATTRAVRHGGNLRYVWALDRRLRNRLPAALPYPRWTELAA